MGGLDLLADATTYDPPGSCEGRIATLAALLARPGGRSDRAYLDCYRAIDDGSWPIVHTKSRTLPVGVGALPRPARASAGGVLAGAFRDRPS
jgi:hypothetical protein